VQKLGGALAIETIYERSRGAKNELLHGAPLTADVAVRENGVRFFVDVLHGQKTGFFLDQRENRRAIGPYAKNRTAVNLFSYSGGFSVHAALAGAKRVTSVDSAKGAIDSAIANFRANDLAPEAHEFVCEDAFAWLDRAHAERRRYDLVVSDPPSFAPSEKTLQRGLNAYRDLHAKDLAITAPGGTLAAASCSSHVTMDAFVGTLRDAAVAQKRRIRVLETRGQPGDHPVPPAFAEGRYLKFVLCYVE
jgi:23S rRNA (cytosine1962-C5)-methyltransferase